jgi:transcriptional regulator with XRE-family HTH domain
MNLGENIKKIRIEKNLKQKDLAEKSHISSVSIGKYERGDKIPSAENLKKIADALVVPIEVLMLTDENMKLIEKDIEEMKSKELVEFAEDIQATVDEYNNPVEDLLNKLGIYIEPISGNDFLLSYHSNIGHIKNKQSLIDDVEKSIISTILYHIEINKNE